MAFEEKVERNSTSDVVADLGKERADVIAQIVKAAGPAAASKFGQPQENTMLEEMAASGVFGVAGGIAMVAYQESLNTASSYYNIDFMTGERRGGGKAARKAQQSSVYATAGSKFGTPTQTSTNAASIFIGDNTGGKQAVKNSNDDIFARSSISSMSLTGFFPDNASVSSGGPNIPQKLVLQLSNINSAEKDVSNARLLQQLKNDDNRAQEYVQSNADHDNVEAVMKKYHRLSA